MIQLRQSALQVGPPCGTGRREPPQLASAQPGRFALDRLAIVHPRLDRGAAALGQTGDLDFHALLVALYAKPVADAHAARGLDPIVVDLHVPALHGRLGEASRAEEPCAPEPLVDPQPLRAGRWGSLALVLLAHAPIIGPL